VTTDDGVRLFVQRLGSGAKAVIIPNGSFLFNVFRPLADDRAVIFYDLRNRGRSDAVRESSQLKQGIHHDVEDLEAVRRHIGPSDVDVIGHSYLGLMVLLHAMKYPGHVRRVVQIGAVPPDHARQYPVELTGADETLLDISTKLAKLQHDRQPSDDPAEFNRKWWSLWRLTFVADPADADKVDWSSGALPNESFANVMKHLSENIIPSIQRLSLTAEDLAQVAAPVLAIHGRNDRQAPYGGGREWAMTLPNARLVTVERAAHLPWIEAPDVVLSSIRTFLDGRWPEAAEKVESLSAPAPRAQSNPLC
jgi:pimeloyl-ACP methyl ester carboxylesterase